MGTSASPAAARARCCCCCVSATRTRGCGVDWVMVGGQAAAAAAASALALHMLSCSWKKARARGDSTPTSSKRSSGRRPPGRQRQCIQRPPAAWSLLRMMPTSPPRISWRHSMQVGGREFVGSLTIHSCGWRVSACPTRLDWSHFGVCWVLRFLTCTTSGADVVTTWSWVAVTGAAPITKTSRSRPEAAIASFCLFCLPRTRLRCFLGPLGAVPSREAMPPSEGGLRVPGDVSCSMPKSRSKLPWVLGRGAGSRSRPEHSLEYRSSGD